MKSVQTILITLMLIISFGSCKNKEGTDDINILFLHHSTGNIIWNGGKSPSRLSIFAGKFSTRLANIFNRNAKLPILFNDYNEKYNKKYSVREKYFPKPSPYGWNNFPYDYYNIWVKNAGEQPYMEEPTIEMLTKKYQVIIFKHCFPVSNIQAGQDSANINSDFKTIENYKLQYQALKDKLLQFPDTKFILFTGAVQVKSQIIEEEAIRARIFFKWVINEWDSPGDNIFLWDLYSLQTEGGLYLREDYAASDNDSHPNKVFASKVSQLLFNRIIDIVENSGTGTQLTGELK